MCSLPAEGINTFLGSTLWTGMSNSWFCLSALGSIAATCLPELAAGAPIRKSWWVARDARLCSSLQITVRRTNWQDEWNRILSRRGWYLATGDGEQAGFDDLNSKFKLTPLNPNQQTDNTLHEYTLIRETQGLDPHHAKRLFMSGGCVLEYQRGNQSYYTE